MTRFATFVGLIFALKLAVVLELKNHPLVQPDVGLDTTAYVELARQVLSGNVGLGPGLYYVSPLYIYFLAATLAVTDSFTAVRIAQIALGTVSVVCLFFTTRVWFSKRAAWLAAALAGLTGLFTFYEALILQAALDACLTSAALLLLAWGLTRDRRHSGAAEGRPLRSKTPRQSEEPRRSDASSRSAVRNVWIWIACGLVFGIASLNRPNMLLAAAGVAVVMLAARRVTGAVLVMAGLLAGLAPVAIRNVVVSHEWSLVSSHGGLNFYIGNGDGATGFYRPIQGISPTIAGQQRDARRVASRALGRPVDDAEASDYFFSLARRWMVDHPAGAAALFFRKLGWTFHAQHIALPYSYPFYAYDARTILRFLAVGPWLLIPLGLTGLVFCAPRERRGAYLVWASFVPAYGAAVALFFVAERYRLPLLVPLAIGSGAAIDRIWQELSARRIAALALPLGTALAIGLAANWPHGLHDGRAEERIRMAERLVIIGRYDEAEQWTERIEASVPRPASLHYIVGAQFGKAGQTERALAHLRRAHTLDPGSADIEYVLGQVLLNAGHAAEALPHLRNGFERGPTIPLAGYDLALALEKQGDLAGAAAIVRRIAPDEDQDVEVWLRLGRLATEVKAPDAAEPFFRRAIAMRPDYPAAHLQYGLTLLVLGRVEDASIELSTAVRLDPRNPEGLAHLAYAEISLGRTADARAHVNAALAIDPSHALARQLDAALRSKGKQTPDAR